MAFVAWNRNYSSVEPKCQQRKLEPSWTSTDSDHLEETSRPACIIFCIYSIRHRALLWPNLSQSTWCHPPITHWFEQQSSPYHRNPDLISRARKRRALSRRKFSGPWKSVVVDPGLSYEGFHRILVACVHCVNFEHLGLTFCFCSPAKIPTWPLCMCSRSSPSVVNVFLGD